MSHWLIRVSGWGSVVFEGTKSEAEEFRVNKADWEGGTGTKRPATEKEIASATRVIKGDSIVLATDNPKGNAK